MQVQRIFQLKVRNLVFYQALLKHEDCSVIESHSVVADLVSIQLAGKDDMFDFFEGNITRLSKLFHLYRDFLRVGAFVVLQDSFNNITVHQDDAHFLLVLQIHGIESALMNDSIGFLAKDDSADQTGWDLGGVKNP